MAAVLTQSNSFQLTGKIGRRPTDAELYMAHFMGVGGAAKLIANAEDNPQASGARLFPNAAAANRSIFYDSTGRARSVSEVYSVLTSRYASAASSPATRAAMAAVGARAGRRHGRQRGLSHGAGCECDLSVELSGGPIGQPGSRRGAGGAGDHGIRCNDNDSNGGAGAGRSDLPLAVPGGRAPNRSRPRSRNCGATPRR